MPEVPRLPPAPAGCRWRPTTEGDYRINPDRRYYSPDEPIHRGSAYWQLLDPQGRSITLEQAPNVPAPPASGGAAVLPGPTQPRPTRVRRIRVSGSPKLDHHLRNVFPSSANSASRRVAFAIRILVP